MAFGKNTNFFHFRKEEFFWNLHITDHTSKFCDFGEIDKNRSRKGATKGSALTVCFSQRGTEDTEKRKQILREPSASVREKNSSRSIEAGKEVRSTALTVYFSHRGTEDTEKWEQILRERKNSSRSIEAGKEVRSTVLTVYFSHRGTEDREAGTNPP
ncbi:MAG: hypothetical protein ACRCUY_13145 [Thermoguttaceae bacterium]